jgi:hypothetical protein
MSSDESYTARDVLGATAEQLLIVLAWVVWVPLVWSWVLQYYREEEILAVTYAAWELGATRIPYALAISVAVWCTWRVCRCACTRLAMYAIAVLIGAPALVAYVFKLSHYAWHYVQHGRVDLEHVFEVTRSDEWLETAYRMGFDDGTGESPFRTSGLAFTVAHWQMGAWVMAALVAVAIVLASFLVPVVLIVRCVVRRMKTKATKRTRRLSYNR